MRPFYCRASALNTSVYNHAVKKMARYSPTRFRHLPTVHLCLPILHSRELISGVPLPKTYRIMETENKNMSDPNVKPASPVRDQTRSHVSGRVFGGLIVLTVGVLLLVKQSGVDLPYWLMTWPMILIAVGLYVGFRHSFRGPAWIVLILLGSLFLYDKMEPDIDFGHLVAPIVLIAIGLIMILRTSKKKPGYIANRVEIPPAPDFPPSIKTDPNFVPGEDYIDTVSIFGGVKKNIFSKNFRGGDITTIFGGTELNFTQAEMQHPIIIDVTQIFGGAKLVVPPHWRIQSEDIVSIFGGVEDKRPLLPQDNTDPTKVLILKGTNIFGGIDIKSY